MTTSIKDVALLAGVSVATVSRALGNGPVSPALRAKVEAAVAQCGYRPNLSARRLRSQHTRTVGLIVSDICNPFFTAVGRAVEDVAYRAGMRVILCNTDENPDKEAMYLRLMQEERVSGVIFAATRATADALDTTELGFPVVMIDRAGAAARCDAVLLDNRLAAAQLVEHLLERGYRRIGGLFGNTSSTGAERHAGFAEALRRAGLPVAARFVAPSAAAAQAELAAWLQEETAPEALVASNGLLLLGAAKAVRAAGVAVPQRLALAGFDNDSWTELAEPGMTVIEQPVDEIGRVAMEMLLERLRQPERPPRKVVLAGRLVARGSSRARA
ncbi:LacI family DNA-binding transcriptional regulator [Chromobacterium amazonense]|uniref:LacI family DNA-binding transcriptional regulator n=1 Tax=Chromobacterium amazonense TaxID=1382803 RepID=A0A2S9X498_9NEIS|nr:LacI family DNA-binding transcriptional regulator [Chromobacterium amazonense]KIA81494.1 LacI family transcriptional regulator [Chromobacterium piscinae]MDQ4542037.1 LacI family DNA-binding transcriptional regulator [Chromobacterium amazonense]PRP70505.1 LacI family transcriptional regulator [Chromobacterium amazonense]